MSKDGIIAQDIEVQRNEPVRIPVEIWKDDKMLFPEFDESIGGRNLVPNSSFLQGFKDNFIVTSYDRSFVDGIAFYEAWGYTGTRVRYIELDMAGLQEGEYVFSMLVKAVNKGSTLIVWTGGTGSTINIPLTDDYILWAVTVNKTTDIDTLLRLLIYQHRDTTSSMEPRAGLHIKWYGLVKGDQPLENWTPAPEELLTIATINAVHCYYEIDGSDIILSNFTENKGYVDIEVSYGDNWVRTKRINFTRKNRIHDIQIKDKKPFRAYFNRIPIWWKYHERTQAIFDYANERYYQLPTNKLAYDDYIRGVVKEGLFDKLDLHYIFSGDGDINFKLLNIINPGTYNGTAFGGLEWTNEGVKGNGVNGYIDTNFIPSLLVEGQKYQLNDASRGIVVTNIGTTTGNNATLDSSRNPNHYNYMRLSSNGANSINAGNEALSATDMSGIGFKSINRFSAENIILTNRENIFNRSATVSILSHLTQVILRGVFSTNYGDQTIAAYMMGSALTFEQTQVFREIYNKYLTAIGLEPIA